MATRTGRSKSKRAGSAERRTTSSKAGAKRAGARSKAVTKAAERQAKSAAGAPKPRMPSRQQQAEQEGGMYLIFQSSDNKIYTIPQSSFGPAEDPNSKTGRCILGHSEFLRSNPGVEFAALISANDAPIKTCGPSGGGGGGGGRN
jgi:hypothetical protein